MSRRYWTALAFFRWLLLLLWSTLTIYTATTPTSYTSTSTTTPSVYCETELMLAVSKVTAGTRPCVLYSPSGRLERSTFFLYLSKREDVIYILCCVDIAFLSLHTHQCGSIFSDWGRRYWRRAMLLMYMTHHHLLFFFFLFSGPSNT